MFLEFRYSRGGNFKESGFGILIEWLDVKYVGFDSGGSGLGRVIFFFLF